MSKKRPTLEGLIANEKNIDDLYNTKVIELFSQDGTFEISNKEINVVQKCIRKRTKRVARKCWERI